MWSNLKKDYKELCSFYIPIYKDSIPTTDTTKETNKLITLATENINQYVTNYYTLSILCNTLHNRNFNEFYCNLLTTDQRIHNNIKYNYIDAITVIAWFLYTVGDLKNWETGNND